MNLLRIAVYAFLVPFYVGGVVFTAGFLYAVLFEPAWSGELTSTTGGKLWCGGFLTIWWCGIIGGTRSVRRLFGDEPEL